MPIMVSEGGQRAERELIPMDLHRAVCVSVVDLGSHMNQAYGKVNRKVRLTFELADCRDDFEVDGEMKNLPRLIGKEYTMSLHERATLRKDLQAWRKKAFTQEELAGFDVAALVGVPCMVNVEHYTGNDGKQHAGIGGIVGLAQGMLKPTPEGDTYYYSIDDHGREFPEAMPEFVKNKVLASIEMGGQQAAAPAPQAPPTPQAPPPFPAAAPTSTAGAGGSTQAYEPKPVEEEECPF